jgi:predicted DsbA family dithiol-disulfide isomerase
MLAAQVGMPIEPPRRNANSRLALETGELVRARAGDEASAAFHHAVSRAFFVDGADIGDVAVVAHHAVPFGISEDDVRAAWTSHAYAGTIDDSMRAAMAAGVTGVPAFGWPGSHAISGMMEPQRIVAILQG